MNRPNRPNRHPILEDACGGPFTCDSISCDRIATHTVTDYGDPYGITTYYWCDEHADPETDEPLMEGM